MNRAPRAHIVTVLAGLVLLGAALATGLMASQATAHGSTQDPASRVYTCRFENPDNPMCAAAWSSNSQALYDWMEVNIGDAAGRHQQLIPDGQLCSAGRAKYAAFDRPGAWPVTALSTNGSGLVDLVYQNTAPHSTEYYRVYITHAGFDARTDTLAWSDLELAYDSGSLGRSSLHTMQAALPNRDIPAILYIVWQRSDSPEAFYACSDVTVNGGSPSPSTSNVPPPSTSAPTTTTPATSMPDTSRPGTSATSAPASNAPSTTTTSLRTTDSQATTALATSTAPPRSTASPTTAASTSAALTNSLPPSTGTASCRRDRYFGKGGYVFNRSGGGEHRWHRGYHTAESRFSYRCER